VYSSGCPHSRLGFRGPVKYAAQFSRSPAPAGLRPRSLGEHKPEPKPQTQFAVRTNSTGGSKKCISSHSCPPFYPMPFSKESQKLLAKLRCPKPQTIPIGKLFESHDILLSHNSNPFVKQWQVVKKRIELENTNVALPNWKISRCAIEKAATACSVDWVELYILTMVWGFGATDDGGPYKLRTSLCASGARNAIEGTAEMVLRGELASAFDNFCTAKGKGRLPETGESFGSKFLYAVGLNSRWKDCNFGYQPLVFDGKIISSLKGLGYWPERFKDNGKRYKNNKPVFDGGLYVKYCEDIATEAARLHWPSTALEQSLFENSKALKD
jgi:hypothetical protein